MDNSNDHNIMNISRLTVTPAMGMVTPTVKNTGDWSVQAAG